LEFTFGQRLDAGSAGDARARSVVDVSAELSQLAPLTLAGAAPVPRSDA